jgi:hypothetical protein
VIASVDAEAIYPSIKFDLIKKAIEYYARNITKENKIDKINKCLDLIKFGMNTTLIQFCGVYYLYNGDKCGGQGAHNWWIRICLVG